ncbi:MULTISPECIES: hypothetical protein [unclassified Polaromonas]|jgi:hypothetical protein|uniref:hypothetical protein n=1 Tax=unclassified Polaromonas TaxID=2638319 RepID=UPI0025EC2B67|nr:MULTISPECIES: hypothetical protein [unclassified Polaromonas]HQR99192.1 hypothetical protein [Polaromonas sp.]HQS40398.1 hypothetical protein [Polaromonas sp.]HQS89053.1 hypothetical protein [Polaromonas sp.]HQT06017.1 hypothetical protein [Polaromonas sp.]
MLTKLNPFGIVKAHFCSLKRYDTEQLSIGEILFHLFFPAALSGLHYLLVRDISENVVGIIVSAASIVAGLMLNLMVLIYTLVYNAKNGAKPISNFSDFKNISSETIASISYSVLLCITLVISSFLILSQWAPISVLGRLSTVYIGTSTILCLLIVLKRCYAIIQFDLKQ